MGSLADSLKVILQYFLGCSAPSGVPIQLSIIEFHIRSWHPNVINRVPGRQLWFQRREQCHQILNIFLHRAALIDEVGRNSFKVGTDDKVVQSTSNDHVTQRKFAFRKSSCDAYENDPGWINVLNKVAGSILSGQRTLFRCANYRNCEFAL